MQKSGDRGDLGSLLLGRKEEKKATYQNIPSKTVQTNTNSYAVLNRHNL